MGADHQDRRRDRGLAHVPEKWEPVFRKGHAPIKEAGAHPDGSNRDALWRARRLRGHRRMVELYRNKDHARGRRMRNDFTIGLVVPFATDEVPDEGLQMYPDVRFIPRGVGVRALTPAGYDSAWEGILPAAEYLAEQDVDAIMVIGTSLTFYRGSDFHDQLLDKLRAATGLPVSTMSQAVVDGLRQFGA